MSENNFKNIAGKLVDVNAVASLAGLAGWKAYDLGQKLIPNYEGITAKTQVGQLAERCADFGIEYGPVIGTAMLAAYVGSKILKR